MIERIATPIRTKEIIEKYNFYFKKNFGQNFLIDSNILENIADAANVTEDDCVLEIGPGIGSLTQVLAERAKKVIAVEIDRNLIPILRDTLSGYDNIEVINSDVLKLDLSELADSKNQGRPIKVVANLPYYITTPIIMELLEKNVNVESMTVMVQKEVAKRMQAVPSTPDYGALSIAVQYYCNPTIDMIVPPSCFMPRPNVESAVITLRVSEEPTVLVKDRELFFKLVRSAFGQRRKTLLNSISNQGTFPIQKERLGELITEVGLDIRIRGEAMSLTEFGGLADLIHDEMSAL